MYQEGVLTPPDRPHCFAYHICIHNDGPEPVTIRGRKWVVRESSGEVIAVEGDGVVGETPTISPGDCFRYSSFHVIHSNRAVAEGSYLGISASGNRLLAEIPAFEMVVPESDPDIGYA